MDSPLIVSLSRQMSVKDQISVIANNIANMSTGAYKAERIMFKDYLARSTTGNTMVFPQQSGIYRLDGAGPISRTSNPLDLALQGDGYLVVETPAGFRYTRNGHLSLDNEGRLVNSQGYPVMDDVNRPFIFDTGVQNITIAEDGSVSADDNRLGKLKLVSFDDVQALERQGASLYKTEAPELPAPEVKVLQGHLEGSNVEPVLEITRFMNAVGSYQHAKKIIDDEYDRQRRAIQMLGSLPER